MNLKRQPQPPEYPQYLSREEIQAATEEAIKHFCHPRLDHRELNDRLTAYLTALMLMVDHQMACRPHDPEHSSRGAALAQARWILDQPPARGCRAEAKRVHALSVRVDDLLRYLPRDERCPTR
ncbi:DUF6415 family natural product biosynthesis protein [Streptomyces mobaraensis]|uniref:Uncharacterized protein n=1 Tax=Streptomyces mobaraensis TaxID=35621 RepID=A0A5N5WEG0_STRMB|nr:DUF6415 family natural product biosynthesis protein [Streptomyces mobaraensis]KAB7850107.1 hypothetical protein FRZ00_05760 [Streptomyces mobaraensis]